MARTVKLRQQWTLGARVGDRSGFGQVFMAVAANGTLGVVKLIPKFRERSIAIGDADLAGEYATRPSHLN